MPWTPTDAEIDDAMKWLTAEPERTSVVLLKGHLLVERYLDRLLGLFPLYSEVILQCRVSFSERIHVLESTKLLNPRIITTLKRLNKVRNEFAHNYDYKVTMNDVRFIADAYFRGDLIRFATSAEERRRLEHDKDYLLVRVIVLLALLLMTVAAGISAATERNPNQDG